MHRAVGALRHDGRGAVRASAEKDRICRADRRAARQYALRPEAADRYGLRLGLESYGDIVGPASECGGVFAELDLPHVQYTYDPGNTYRFCRGEIRLDEDLQNASVPVAYLHMKDGSIHDGYIWNEPIGQGVFPYPAMLAALERQGGTLGCALEMPMSFCVSVRDLSFRFLEPSDEQLYAQIMQSVEYVKTLAHVTM